MNFIFIFINFLLLTTLINGHRSLKENNNDIIVINNFDLFGNNNATWTPKININKINIEKCEECKLITKQIDDLAIKHETEIITYLQNFCNFIPIQQQPYCNDIIKLSLPNIIENFSPDILCKEINLCKTTGLINWILINF